MPAPEMWCSTWKSLFVVHHHNITKFLRLLKFLLMTLKMAWGSWNG